jgi:ribonuclease P/MRP protein subunit RPP1
MKKNYADLHLQINPKDPTVTTKTIKKAANMGYKIIATTLYPQTQPQETQNLKDTCKQVGLDFVTRIDLRPRNQNELLAQLRKLRRKFEVICVLCETKEVARQAAKDRRVDLLNFPQLDYRDRFFDRAEAELASNSLATLELDIKPLLLLEGPARIRFLSCLRREAQVAKDFHLPVVISSGVSDPMHLRKPREMAALASLFGLENTQALEAVSHNPIAIVKRNRDKLSAKFVAPGINIVKEGKDC